ncbi:hypothetical protein CPB86DRAFT_451084 [Serendipita vermifera]|nr:hypothetical protein CPB86DRAFT_451084 [Serendipita vermifera]
MRAFMFAQLPILVYLDALRRMPLALALPASDQARRWWIAQAWKSTEENIVRTHAKTDTLHTYTSSSLLHSILVVHTHSAATTAYFDEPEQYPYTVVTEETHICTHSFQSTSTSITESSHTSEASVSRTNAPVTAGTTLNVPAALATPLEYPSLEQVRGTLLPVEPFFEEGETPLYPFVTKKGASSRSSKIVSYIIVPLLLVALAIGLLWQFVRYRKLKKRDICQEIPSGTLTPSGSDQMLMVSNSYDELELEATKGESIRDLAAVKRAEVTFTKKPPSEPVHDTFKSIKGSYGCEGATFRGAAGFMFPSTFCSADHQPPRSTAFGLHSMSTQDFFTTSVSRNLTVTSNQAWNTRSKRGPTNPTFGNATIHSRRKSPQGDILYTTTGKRKSLDAVNEEDEYPGCEGERSDEQDIVPGDDPLATGVFEATSSPNSFLEYPTFLPLLNEPCKPLNVYKKHNINVNPPTEHGSLSRNRHRRSLATTERLGELAGQTESLSSLPTQMVLDDDAGFQEFLRQLGCGYAVDQLKQKNVSQHYSKNGQTLLLVPKTATAGFSTSQESSRQSSFLVPLASFGANLSDFGHSSSSLDSGDQYTSSDSISAIGTAL